MGFLWRGSGALSLVVLTTTPTHAADDAPTAPATDAVDQCADSFESAQEARDQGQLVRAREALLTCSRDPCPTVIQQDCREWLFDLEPRIPTVVLRVRLADGTDVTEVRVFADGKLLTTKLDGRPVRIDPGEHRLLWQRQGFEPTETRIVVREGEKNRFVSAEFPDSRPAAPPPVARPRTRPAPAVPLGTWIGGGVAVAGLATFAVLGTTVLTQEAHLRNSCAPHCHEDDVRPLESRAVAANVALGVGLAGVAVAAVAYFFRGDESGPPAVPAVGLERAPGGAAAVLRGRF